MTECRVLQDRASHSTYELLEYVDLLRVSATGRINRNQRSKMGQFLTPAPVAKLMASLFRADHSVVRLLDAGAGIGTLSAAFVQELCLREQHPRKLEIVAYEIEPRFIDYLKDTMDRCEDICRRVGIEFQAEILMEDFIEAGVLMLKRNLFSPQLTSRFDCAILNPPYKKIQSTSRERLLLRSAGIETSNLYTGFLAIVIQLLKDGGELVAITPRSFCNGPYFRSFRKLFLEQMVIRHVHLFNARDKVFQDDEVLQENVILYCEKGTVKPKTVVITSNDNPDDDIVTRHTVDYSELVNPLDSDFFIHLKRDDLEHKIADCMTKLTTTLEDLDLEVSTGRVVDFRVRNHLRKHPTVGTVPLIYPGHLENGAICWPRQLKGKPNAIVEVPETEDLLVPPGVYVLVKRFTSKEEKKRVVAAVYNSDVVFDGRVGFENHLNYFHRNGRGLPLDLAKGLAIFLNSTLVDIYFRQFNGHTQVNATDLRKLHYPSIKELETLGSKVGDSLPDQREIDDLVMEVLTQVAGEATVTSIQAKRRIDEAIGILRQLGLPNRQLNERSALTLLALLDLGPETPWSEASPVLRGITEMMTFFKDRYGKQYAPNTRETVRRFSVHQFIQAGLVTQNPDDPGRPTNSPNNRYRITDAALNLLRAYGTPNWDRKLREYLASYPTLSETYARKREIRKVPVILAPGKSIKLSPGGQNELVKKVIDEFCSRFTPGAEVVYVGDAADKWAYFNQPILKNLHAEVEEHGKMPDVVVYQREKNWLVLIEVCSSHGPVDHKRHIELKKLFENATAGLVFVTAFPDRRTLAKYLSDIAWETEVWVAEHPDHLIHFNGERFLGPYNKE